MTESAPKVLSIQSHVVSGYVGNRAATFPLQTLGYDVDVINTVHFSNHTGYGHTKGHKTQAHEIHEIFGGLKSNGLLHYDRILTGYIAGGEALRAVATEIKSIKRDRPEVIYLLDPVMGDDGRLYVSPEVVEIYKELLPLSTIITPNYFEMELLSGTKIKSVQTVIDTITTLHSTFNIPHIVVSSVSLPWEECEHLEKVQPPSEYLRLLPNPAPKYYSTAGESPKALVCFASSRNDESHAIWAFLLPQVSGYFSGVGDLFSTLILAHFHPEQVSPLRSAVAKALLAVQQILLRSHVSSLQSDAAGDKAQQVIPSDDELDENDIFGKPSRKAKRMKIRELRIIQERALLTEPGEWPSQRIL